MMDLAVAFGLEPHRPPLASNAPVKPGMRVLVEVVALMPCVVDQVKIDHDEMWLIHNMAHGSRSLIIGAAWAPIITHLATVGPLCRIGIGQTFAMDVEYIGTDPDGALFRAHLWGAL